MPQDLTTDIEHISEKLSALEKSTWITSFEPCEKEAICSKYYGYPYITPQAQWPERDNEKIPFVFQLSLSDLPENIQKDLKRDSGFIQLFMELDDYDEEAVVRFVDLHEDGRCASPDLILKEEIPEEKRKPLSDEEHARLKTFSLREMKTNPEAIALRERLYFTATTNSKYMTRALEEETQKVLRKKSFKISSFDEKPDFPHPAEIYESEEPHFQKIADDLDALEDEHEIDMLDEVYASSKSNFETHDTDKAYGYPFWLQGPETPDINGEKMKFLYQLSGLGKGKFISGFTAQIFYLP